MATIIQVNISEKVGTPKHPVEKAVLKENFGIEGDAHSGTKREVSLLSLEEIEKVNEGLPDSMRVSPGDFAENITTKGLDLAHITPGDLIVIGDSPVILEVIQIGKECHVGCSVVKRIGRCIMPKLGIFASVKRGGKVSKGDRIRREKKRKVAILTISDSSFQGKRVDESGPLIQKILQERLPNFYVVYSEIIPDEKAIIIERLRDIADRQGCDLVITTGGTGIFERDVTPDATLEVLDKELPGIPEAMRIKTLSFTSRAMLSRARAGIRKKTIIINLPGSPKAVEECLDVVLPAIPHAIEILKGVNSHPEKC